MQQQNNGQVHLTITITPESIERHRKQTEEYNRNICDSSDEEIKRNMLQHKELQEIERFMKEQLNPCFKNRALSIRNEFCCSLHEMLELWLICNFYSKKEKCQYKVINNLVLELKAIESTKKDKQINSYITLFETLLHNNESYTSNRALKSILSYVELRIRDRIRKNEPIVDIAKNLSQEIKRMQTTISNDYLLHKQSKEDLMKRSMGLVAIKHGIAYSLYKLTETISDNAIEWLTSMEINSTHQTLFEAMHHLCNETTANKYLDHQKKCIANMKKANNNLEKYFNKTNKAYYDVTQYCNIGHDFDYWKYGRTLYSNVQEFINMGKEVLQSIEQRMKRQNRDDESQKKNYANHFQTHLIRSINYLFNYNHCDYNDYINAGYSDEQINKMKDYHKSKHLTHKQIGDFICNFNSVADMENKTVFDEEYVKQILRSENKIKKQYNAEMLKKFNSVYSDMK